MLTTSSTSKDSAQDIAALESRYRKALESPLNAIDASLHAPTVEQIAGFRQVAEQLYKRTSVYGTKSSIAVALLFFGICCFSSFYLGYPGALLLLLFGALAQCIRSDRAAYKWRAVMQWLTPLSSQHGCETTLKLATSCDEAKAYRQEVIDQGREFCLLDAELIEVLAKRHARKVQQAEFNALAAAEEAKRKQACLALHGLTALES